MTRGALRIAGTGREIEKARKSKIGLAPSIQETVQSLLTQVHQISTNLAEVKPEPDNDTGVADMEATTTKKRKAASSSATQHRARAPPDSSGVGSPNANI